MSWSTRRALFLVAALAALGTISGIGQLFAQKVPPIKRPPMPPEGGPGAKPVRDAFDLGSLTLPKEDELQERVEAAADNIKRKNWDRACETLQSLLVRPGDVFVPLKKKDASGREADIYVSVKKEAQEMIGNLPKEGKAFYEATYGERAATMVKAAKKNNDPIQMGIAMSVYLHTKAGAEAAAWLATHMLDRAEFQGAARVYSILIARTGLTNQAELKDRTLIKAAIAFNAANDTESRKSYDLVFTELKRRGVELKLRDEPVSVAEIKADLDKLVVVTSEQSASDSLLFRGRMNRTAMLPGGTPFLDPSWKLPMSTNDRTKGYIKTAETALQSRALPILSSFVPVTATITKEGKKTSLLVYRSWRGVHAVNMATGKQVWGANTDWDLDIVNSGTDTNKSNYYSNAISQFSASNMRPQILLENSVQGMLSADAQNVYTVEDLAVPPPASWFMGGFPASGPAVQAAMTHNKLVAYSLARGGRLVWEVGGSGKGPVDDSFFLSAPLPLNNKLYVLTERQQELRLATLDPNGDGKGGPKVLTVQPLATVKDLKMQTDPLRRTQAAHLAYAEGILVVPTNAGAVFGIDTMSNALLWAYPYREVSDAPAPPGGGGPGGGKPPFPGGLPGLPIAQGSLQANWQVTAPAIADGKVVFTAPDGRNIHCINLRDGTRQWAAPREDGDLYFAGVFGGKAVIVGEKRTRGLNLKNGGIEWKVDHGQPSGLGAASNTGGEVMYYLPIRESLTDRQPEIIAINVDKGFIHAHTRSRKGEVAGNLLFFEGRVLSQSHLEVAAYPQIEVELARLDKLVEEKANDPALLTERGDYLLDKGDLARAIADLRKALANKPDAATLPKARAKLYEAFTELFQRDFARAESYIPEYEEVCKVSLDGLEGPARTAAMEDARKRRANFLCLVGKGREAQGRLTEAFEKYLELGAGARPDELIQVIDEPSVKAAPDVWSQGRIAQMISRATDAKEKAALEKLITARWEKVKGGKAEDVRKFVALFGSLFGVGREARFTLAEKLMDDTDLSSLLEAEQHLTVLRGDANGETAARAIEALARLNTRKGLLEDAAYYYRVLGERYPNVTIDGKKGSEHLEDLSTDKRFLPYLGSELRFKVKGKVKFEVRESTGSHSTPVYQLANLGDPLPYFIRNKIGYKVDWSNTLEVHDTATGERKSRQVDRTAFMTVIQSPLFPTTSKLQFGYQTVGHTVVLQLGHKVYGIDPLGKEPRILWTENLSQLPGTDNNPPPMDPARSQPMPDSRDGAALMEYSDGSMQRLGVGGPLQAGVVCLLRRDSLTAIDPITGRKLWVRTDINSRSHIFGDGQNLYVVALDPKGNAAGTRAIRAHDGGTIRGARDFSPEFDTRQRIIGSTILSKVTNNRNETTMSLYDVAEGKTVWQHQFPANTVVVDSTDPDLVGGVEPATGKITIFSLKARKAVLEKAMRDPKHALNAEAITLAADQDTYFLAVKQPDDPNQIAQVWYDPTTGQQVNGTMSNMQRGIGARTARVNGFVYAFRRSDNALMWFNEVRNTHLLLTGLEDSPALHFNARYMGWVGNGPARMQQMEFTAVSYAKHNGKMCLDQPKLPQNMMFTEYTTDPRTGEMVAQGSGRKWTITIEPIKPATP
jgi:outer membrane protein assembly factor BamB/tetratricopeptide (TPR) repeat protein